MKRLFIGAMPFPVPFGKPWLAVALRHSTVSVVKNATKKFVFLFLIHIFFFNFCFTTTFY